MNEVVLKIINALHEAGSFDEAKAAFAIEMVLDDYTVTAKSTELTVMTDMPEKIDFFLQSKRIESRLSLKTVRNYRYQLRRFSDFIYKPVNLVTDMDIRKWLAITGKNLKASTVATKIYCLKSFFGWLHKEGMIPKNPAYALIVPEQPKRLKKGMSVVELEKARSACISDRERAMLEAYLSTAGRLSDLVEAKISNIVDGEMIVIGKGDKESSIFFGEKAIHYIKIYVKNRGCDDDYLFMSERKYNGKYKPIGGPAIERAVGKIGKRCGVHIHPHKFRHTAANMMLENGMSLDDVQEILRHSDPKTTQIYARNNRANLKISHKKHAIA